MGLPATQTQTGLHLITEPSREPIANIEVEEAAIACMLLDPSAYYRAADILSADYFYSSAYQEIYRAIATLNQANWRSDVTSVAAELQDKGTLERVGGASTLTALLDRAITSANVDQYALLIREKWQRRQMLGIAAHAEALARQSGNVPDLLSRLRDRVDEIAIADGGGEWMSIHETADELREHSEALERGEKVPGYAWGYTDVDALLQGGSQPGTLTFLAGRPGMGKTAVMIAAAANQAQGVATGIYSMEMKRLSLAQRLIAMREGLWLSSVQSMRLSPQDRQRFSQGLQSLPQVENLFIRESRMTVEQLCNDAKIAINRYGLKNIWIDHLHEFPNSEDTAELTRICNKLKDLAFTKNVAINVLAQLNRDVDSRTNKRPFISDIRQSGTIEQVAQKIVLLYRDEYYNPETPDRGIVEVILGKQRNGPVGKTKLLFEPHFCRFRNLAKL